MHNVGCTDTSFYFSFQNAGAEEAIENGGRESQLFKLVLDWARNNTNKSKPKVELLTEEVGVGSVSVNDNNGCLLCTANFSIEIVIPTTSSVVKTHHFNKKKILCCVKISVLSVMHMT